MGSRRDREPAPDRLDARGDGRSRLPRCASRRPCASGRPRRWQAGFASSRSAYPRRFLGQRSVESSTIASPVHPSGPGSSAECERRPGVVRPETRSGCRRNRSPSKKCGDLESHFDRGRGGLRARRCGWRGGWREGLRLTRILETEDTVTLAWKRQPGAIGYLFLRNGGRGTHVRPIDHGARFWKGSRYAVADSRSRPCGAAAAGARASLVVSRPRSAPTVRRPSRVRRRPQTPVRLRLVSQTPGRSPSAGSASSVSTAIGSREWCCGFRHLRSVDDDGDVLEGRPVRGGCSASETRQACRLRRASHRADHPPRRGARDVAYRTAPRVGFKLRVVAQTPTTVTFRWKRQPGIDGYQFVRNGKVVSQTSTARRRRRRSGRDRGTWSPPCG